MNKPTTLVSLAANFLETPRRIRTDRRLGDLPSGAVPRGDESARRGLVVGARHGFVRARHGVPLLCVLAGLLLLGAAPMARAQCVTNANDSGSGSLRACIAAATSGSTITFSSSVYGQTITLASTITINVPMTITGPGANLLTISGGNAVEVFQVGTNTSAPTVTIAGLTIANGKGLSVGGGIFNWGTLTVSDSTFSGNFVSSPTSAEGGAIMNRYTLTVRNCTFIGNYANAGGGYLGAGGAIYDGGFEIVITNSTFVGNSTNVEGGAIQFNSFDYPLMTNSTFYGNSAPSGQGGAIGRIADPGDLTVSNSIFAGDKGGECDNDGGGCPANGSSGNLVGGTVSLAPLGWYGGTTPTMIPLPGSAAICAGVKADDGGITSDQRGFRLDATCSSGQMDAGAVQTNYLVVTNTLGTTDGTPDCNGTGTGTTCSLADALTAAKTSPNTSGTDIAFASGATPTITLTATLPPITGLLDVVGPGANLLTVSGGNSTSVGTIFTANSGASAAFSGLTIANGSTGGNGGGINNGGTLTVTNSTLSGNAAGTDGGGGIYNGGTLAVASSTFLDNSAGASSEGGGIWNGGTLTVTNSTFSANMAGLGGGMHNEGTVTVTNSTFSANSGAAADSVGGGIENYGGTLTVENSIFSGNAAYFAGAGIINAATANASYNVFYNNVDSSSSDEDDCNSCTTNSSAITADPKLAALGGYGGLTQTLLPLPGSAAICAGSPGLVAGLLNDQRGLPRLNTTYTGYTSSSPCLDAGAVQTNYQSVQFTNAGSGYSGAPGVAISNPAAPIVSVTENSQNIGGVPVTLSFSGTQPTTSSGLGPVPTVAGAGAEFDALEVSPAGNYTLDAALPVVGSYSLSATAGLDISGPASTTTSVSGSSPSTYGQSVTFTATVTDTSTTAVPTGSVQFQINGSNAGSAVTLTAATSNTSTATYTTSTLAASTTPYNVTAIYTNSDGNFTGSTSSAFQQTVQQAQTSTGIIGSTGSSTYGQSVMFTATVTNTSSSVAPTGTVQFFNGSITNPSNAIGSAVTLTPGTGNKSTASFTTSSLNANSPSQYSINASYSGTANFLGSNTTGSSVLMSVSEAQTSVSVGSSANPSGVGQQVTFTATVTNTSSSAAPTGGTVSLYIDGSPAGSGALTAATGNTGTATITHTFANSNPPNPHSITAQFNGDDSPANFSSSTLSSPLSQTVASFSTTTTVGSSANPSSYDQTVTFTATVHSSGGSPTGSVQFVIDGGGPTTVSLTAGSGNNSSAQISTSALTIGGSPHSVMVTYGGFNAFTGSTGSLSPGQTVNPYAFTYTIGNDSQTYGTAANLTADLPATISTGVNGENLAISYSSSGDTATANAGGYAITATLSNGTGLAGNYSVTLTSGTLTVNRYAFSYTIGNDSQTYGTPANLAADLPATISTGLNGQTLGISYSSAGDTATANMGTYAITGVMSNGTGLAGNYSVTLTNGTLTVNRYAFSYTIGNDSQTYGTPANLAADLPATISTGVNGQTLGISYSSTGDTATASVATYAITGVVSNGTGLVSNYSVTLTNGTLTVNRATLTVTPSPNSATMTYGGTVPALSPSYSGFVNGTVTVPGAPTCATTVTSTSAAGSYPGSSSCTGGTAPPNYTFSYAAGSVTVSPATLTVTPSPNAATMTYGGTVPALSPSYSGFVNGTVAVPAPPSCTTTVTSTSAAGSYPGSSSCTGGTPPANYTFSYATGAVTVGTASLTITASSTSMTYGGTAPAVTPGYSGFVNGDSASSLTPQPTCSTTATSSTPAGTDAGANTCSGAADPNYNFTYVAGNVTISKATLTITASGTSMTYGGTPPSVTPLYSAFAGTDTVNSLTTAPTCVTTASNTTPAGTDTGANTCSGAVDNNYNFTYVAGNVTVSKATLTITASSTSMTYGATPPVVTPGYSGFAGSDTVASLTTAPTCVTTATSSTLAGTDTGANTCSGAADPNYNFTYVAGNVTVNKATPTVTLVSSKNPVLSLNPITFTATVASAASTPTGSVSFYDGTTLLGSAVTLTAGVATYTTSSLAIAAHPITAIYSGDSNFVTVTSSVLTQTVQDFTLNISTSSGGSTTGAGVPGGTVTYVFQLSPSGGTTFPAAITLTANGLPAGATATFTPATIAAGAGTTTVTLVIQLANQILASNPAIHFGVAPGFSPALISVVAAVSDRRTAVGTPPLQSAALPTISGRLLDGATFLPRCPLNPLGRSLALVMVGGIFLLPLGGRMRRSRGRAGRFVSVLLLALALTCAALGFTACGGGGNGFFGQQVQNYTVTITGTSGALSHTTTVTLTVQ